MSASFETKGRFFFASAIFFVIMSLKYYMMHEVEPMVKRLSRILTAVFFAAVLLLGLFTAADYGPTWDEWDEMDILRMNAWEYAHFFGMDESAFESRAAAANPLTINALSPISESIEQDHGIASFYPLMGVVLNPALSQ